MSLDKSIKHGKEHREEYRGSKSFDLTCRPHGGGRKAYPCPWCERARRIGWLRLVSKAEDQGEM